MDEVSCGARSSHWSSIARQVASFAKNNLTSLPVEMAGTTGLQQLCHQLGQIA